jgi:predicted metal-binding protein
MNKSVKIKKRTGKRERYMNVAELAAEKGMITCKEIDPKTLVPEERIRAYCIENKCGNYGKNYTCPPHAGTLEEINTRIRKYSHGLLLQYSVELDVSKNIKAVLKTKDDFHKKILETEEFLKSQGINDIWGMIGGNCGLCDTCSIVKEKPCRHPDKSRMSLEALGIDVGAVLDRLGIKLNFAKDRITWTGCILYNK